MRRLLSGVLAGIATAGIGAVMAFTPVGIDLEQNTGLGWLFQLRGPMPPPREVAVVAIDDQTGSRLGLSRLPREWPRAVHAQLVDHLAELGAAVIVFDFDFQTPRNPADDQLFADAIRRADRVVLAAKLVGKRQRLTDANGQEKGSVWVEQLVPPTPPLADAAAGLGPFPLPKVQVAVHDFWVFKPSVGDAATMPAVALQVLGLRQQPDILERLQQAAAETRPNAPAGMVLSGGKIELRRRMAHTRHLYQEAEARGANLPTRLAADAPAGRPGTNPNLSGALLKLYRGPDHRYLNFYGPPGTIATIPFDAILQDAAEARTRLAANLSGRVVFVGYSDLYDPGQPDRFYTVFTNDDGVDLSGVEIAATAFTNLLHDESLTPLDGVTTLGLITAIGGAFGLSAYLLPAILGVPLLLAASAGYAVTAYQAFTGSALWLPLAIPLLIQLPLALFIGLGSHYLLERRRRYKATQAISYYLPEHVARDFTDKVADPSTLNKVVYGCCFASDMAGFTTISEQLRPKELAVFLNDYFETLSQPLRRHHVDVVEFRADGIMCAWTAEEPDGKVRHRAIAAALDAINAMESFKARNALLEQSLRIGLEVGMIYIGHAGGGGHFVYSIVGDSANTSARVEGLNKRLGTQILATRAAVADVEDLLLRHVGDFRFVGKTSALPVVEVMARRSAASSAQVACGAGFDAAMQIMGEGRWAEAAAAFAALLETFPADGPSRFHLDRCRRVLSGETEPDEPWVIALDSK